MKVRSFFLFLLLVGVVGQVCAGGKLEVTASTLDIADIVRAIGGERVEVYPIFKGLTDLHFFEPIPSQVMKLKNADMLVVVGLDADVWIRPLIDASRNSRIRFGAVGYVDPSDGIIPIQVPEGRIDGAMGHVHPYGNPHYWLRPENLSIAVENIYEGLVRISPDDEAYFRSNRDAYLREIDTLFRELQEKMAPFRGSAVIEYHQSWDYFCDFFGLEVIATLEPKPGIPPSAKHLSEVVRIANGRNAKLMLVEPYYPSKPVRYIERETEITALRLPIYLGTIEEVGSLLDLFRYDVDRIVEALSEGGSR